MIDIKFIRKHPETIKQAAIDKNIKCDVDRLLVLDKRKRELLTELNELKNIQKITGQKIAKIVVYGQ